jgi:hypothetical protein
MVWDKEGGPRPGSEEDDEEKSIEKEKEQSIDTSVVPIV